MIRIIAGISILCSAEQIIYCSAWNIDFNCWFFAWTAACSDWIISRPGTSCKIADISSGDFDSWRICTAILCSADQFKHISAVDDYVGIIYCTISWFVGSIEHENVGFCRFSIYICILRPDRNIWISIFFVGSCDYSIISAEDYAVWDVINLESTHYIVIVDLGIPRFH